MSVFSQLVSIDENFGGNGTVVIPNGGVEFVNFDKQGNIIALGYSSLSCPTIIKTDANGIIDTNFGNNGLVILNEYGSNLGTRYGIKITDENKIVVIFLLYSNGVVGPDDPPQYIIMRLNENGTIDENFGVNGKIILKNAIMSVNTENDDFMLIAFMEDYYDDNGYNQDTYISKYNYNGEIDSNFGVNEKAYLTGNRMRKFFPNSIKILNNQSIILAGSNESSYPIQLAFCKLNPNGNFATNFANNGALSMNIDNNPYSKLFTNIIEESNGNLVFTAWLNGHVRHNLLCGFNSNGTINNNFGNNGFFNYLDDNSSSKQVALQNENKFLIGNDNKIMSINNNGTFDTHFNNTGSFVFESFKINDIKKQTSNKFIIGGNGGLLRLNISYETSIKSNEILNSLVIFPNPAKEVLYFSKETAFEIIDTQGNVLLKSTASVKSVNIADLGAGIYFVRFGSDVKKFVKE